MKINDIKELNEFDLKSAAGKVANGVGAVFRAPGAMRSGVSRFLQTRTAKKKYSKLKRYALNMAIVRWKDLLRIKGGELKKKTVYYNTLTQFLVHQFHLNSETDTPKLTKLFRRQDISNDIVKQAFLVAFDLMYINMNYPSAQEPTPKKSAAPQRPARQPAQQPAPPVSPTAHRDLQVKSALNNLGYNDSQINNVISGLDPNLDEANAIKAALKAMAPPNTGHPIPQAPPVAPQAPPAASNPKVQPKPTLNAPIARKALAKP